MFRVPVQPLLLIALALLPIRGCAPPPSAEAASPPPPAPPPIIQTVMPKIDGKLLKAPAAPSCAVKVPSAPESDKPGPEQLADPKLLEIARLEIERDCYKTAERASRKKLDKLQQTIRSMQ